MTDQTTGALAIIRGMQVEIASMGASNAYEYMIPAKVYQFGERLEAFEPFKTIARSWLVFPLGGGRSGGGVSGRWAWTRLLHGAEPHAILAAASSTVAANRYEAQEIRVVKGISVSQPHRLTSTASLVPNNLLAKQWPHQRAFRNDMLGEQFPTDTAALVQDIIVEPAILPSHDQQEGALFTERQAVRDTYAARLRLALGLASGGPVEMPLVYAELSADSIFFGAGTTLSHKPTMAHFSNDVAVDIETTLSFYAELEAMQMPRALELSIDRLLRSRLGRTLEDRIIDLGMAAEIALMHSPKGSGDGKSEITNKLSNRGAWLLADSPLDRLNAWQLLSELYTARSAVVHTGEASGRLQSRVGAFDEVIVRVVRALLRRGAFPDWRLLVLGGGDT